MKTNTYEFRTENGKHLANLHFTRVDAFATAQRLANRIGETIIISSKDGEERFVPVA